MKTKTITVKKSIISLIQVDGQDYISLTDMTRTFDDGPALIEKWLRNKNTVEFMGIWERINNPLFNTLEFEGIMREAGLNRFILSVKKWMQRTGAVGLVARAGRYGSGTFAHKDIAFEFGSWLSPEFKLYLIKEFQRLKQEEQARLESGWNLQRTLAKVNYRIHTDAIREMLIPGELTRQQVSRVYADEADILNVVLFGMTAKEWREAHPSLEGNIRDHAGLEQLVVLSNLESLNAVLIQQGLDQMQRLQQLNKIAISQMKSLTEYKPLRRLQH